MDAFSFDVSIFAVEVAVAITGEEQLWDVSLMMECLNSRYTMVFGSNIIQTRLPDAKQLIKSKKNGKLVVFDPDFCATAAKVDEWVALKLDTDAALALGMAKVIIDNKALR